MFETTKIAPGNKVIQDGRATMDRGAKLCAQGEKAYMKNKANPSVAKQGLKMMAMASISLWTMAWAW